ncbi:hypothetical protein EIP86_005971 [Pleurotus ostreatoroseus]|nr:hypothetical protein EIP86_005971 [Pleurotus ostreatoroseus]
MTNPHTQPYKPARVAPSAASEPSEPSALRPEDKPRAQLTHEQEENPQVVAHRKGRQAADGHYGGNRNKERKGEEGVLDKSAKEGFAGEKRAGAGVKARL